MSEEQAEITVEDKARTLGWKPKEEFSGPEEKWVDADTFVENGEKHAALAIDNNKRLMEEVAQLKRLREADSKKFEKMLKLETERVRKEYEEKKEQAYREGDFDKYRDMEKRLSEYHKIEKEIEDESSHSPEINPDHQRAVEEFEKRNEWYSTRPSMRIYATHMSDKIANEAPNLTAEQHLREVERRVQEEFPDYFSSSKTASVASGRNGITRTKSLTYNSLPPEAKAACDDQVKRFGISKDEWMKHYIDMMEKSK